MSGFGYRPIKYFVVIFFLMSSIQITKSVAHASANSNILFILVDLQFTLSL